MKKIFIPLMAASFLFIGFNGTASAQTSNENKNQLNKVTEVKTNSFIDEYGDMVIEKRKYNSENDLIEVSVEKEESAHSNGSVSLQASGAYHANSRATIVGRFEAWSGAPQMRLYANGFSDAYTNSKKTKKKSISRISVSTTLQMSGAIEAQSSDSKKEFIIC